MKQHQDQPNNNNFTKESEEANRASDPVQANTNNNDESKEKIKDNQGEKKVKNDRRNTKFSPTKRIRPLL